MKSVKLVGKMLHSSLLGWFVLCPFNSPYRCNVYWE